jgi:DNA-binding NarL/FixJ family response regulator
MGAIRVLVADDHTIVRQGLVGILKASDDIEVVGEAGDGAQLRCRSSAAC